MTFYGCLLGGLAQNVGNRGLKIVAGFTLYVMSLSNSSSDISKPSHLLQYSKSIVEVFKLFRAVLQHGQRCLDSSTSFASSNLAFNGFSLLQ